MPNLSKLFFSWGDYKRILEKVFVPNAVIPSIHGINLEELIRQGYRTLLLDVDNTLLRYSEIEVSLRVHQWVSLSKTLGMRILLVSNNSRGYRIKRVAKQLEVHGTYFSMKPLSLTGFDLARKFEILPQECVVVGDQLLTDVVFGNLFGAYTILVDPLDPLPSFTRVLQRELELKILRYFEE